MNKRCSVLVTLAALSGVASGDVYKYIDEDGNVIFTDKPPTEIESEIVDLPSYDPPSTPTLIGRVEGPAGSDQDIDKNERRRINNLVQDQVSGYERRCVEARVALEVLHQGMPVYWVRDGEYRAASRDDTYEGRRVYLSEDERQAAIDNQLQKLIQNCADPLNAEQQEQASTDWINKEQCTIARKDLEFFLQPNRRATDEFLDRKREMVKRYCGE